MDENQTGSKGQAPKPETTQPSAGDTGNQPIQQPGESQPQQAPVQEAATPAKTDNAPEMQQPHLIKSAETKKKRLPFSLPHSSFLIALITITVTIVIGFSLAQLLKSFFQRETTEETTTTPTTQVTAIPTQEVIHPPRTDTTTEKSIPAGSFDDIMEPTAPKTATSSAPPTATQEGQPI